jgi:hypothetical protein
MAEKDSSETFMYIYQPTERRVAENSIFLIRKTCVCGCAPIALSRTATAIILLGAPLLKQRHV